MKITLSPQRRDDTLTVFKQGDALTINGTEFNFTELPDGATLPLYSTDENKKQTKNIDCEWIVSDIQRINGELELTLILPHGADASESARFPDPIINPADGELELPQ
jgi:hypothetical protein